MAYNNKEKIIKHYDFVSPYYYTLWGEHLHHGYWVTGKETKEEAQLALTEHLAQVSNIKHSSKILDVGCGFGASSFYLAKKYKARTTGISISPVQVTMAQEEAKRIGGGHSRFLLMDADNMVFNELFDVVWSVESISHYKNMSKFLKTATKLLMPGGTVAIIDWFKKEDLSSDKNKKYIQPIEKGMLVNLYTMNDYVSVLKSNGLEVVKTDDMSKNCAKTWDISLDIIKNKMFWKLAIKNGKEIVNFLRSFRAMKNGFSSGNFVYGLIVMKKGKL